MKKPESISDNHAVSPLAVLYVTTTSAVLVCEVAPTVTDFDTTHWEIFVAKEDQEYDMNSPIIFTPPYDTNVILPSLYYRLLRLDREQGYKVQVRPVATAETGPLTEEQTFTTAPRF